MLANDAFEKSLKAFHQPLDEVLHPAGNQLHVACANLRHEDETKCPDPSDQHGVGDRETKEVSDLDGSARQAMLLSWRGGMSDCLRCAKAGCRQCRDGGENQ